MEEPINVVVYQLFSLWIPQQIRTLQIQQYHECDQNLVTDFWSGFFDPFV